MMNTKRPSLKERPFPKEIFQKESEQTRELNLSRFDVNGYFIALPTYADLSRLVDSLVINFCDNCEKRAYFLTTMDPDHRIRIRCLRCKAEKMGKL